MHLLHIRSYYSKKENEQNKNFTEKRNSINIYKSMHFMLLHSRNNSRNVWLEFGKCNSQVVFATKSVPFFRFYVYHCRKGILTKIRCNKQYKHLKGFLSKKRVSYDLVTPKRRESYCSEELLLNLALLKFNDFIRVFSIDICCINTKREQLSYPCWI